MSMKMAVIGAGAMGSLFGAYLAKAGEAVTVVDIIRERLQSDTLASMAAFIIVLFFCIKFTNVFKR